MGCSTQWRVSWGGPYGLDYHAARDVADGYGVEWGPALLERLRILEADRLGIGNPDERPHKRCRNAAACSMCRKKQCIDRIG